MMVEGEGGGREGGRGRGREGGGEGGRGEGGEGGRGRESEEGREEGCFTPTSQDDDTGCSLTNWPLGRSTCLKDTSSPSSTCK